VLPGTIGLIMATETIKLILNIGQPLVNRLMLYDSLRMSFKEVKLRKNPACELCGDHPTITELVDYEAFCAVELPSVAAAVPANGGAVELSAPELKAVLDSGRPVTLLDVREPHEWEIARIPGARLTPLSQFESFIPQLRKDDDIYLYCYKGKRSMTALNKLKDAGFKNLHSLAGGIDKWSTDVDPSVPRY
jgi:sulfur-carrier protein adenylyltransferase/sulfurtransferase